MSERLRIMKDAENALTLLTLYDVDLGMAKFVELRRKHPKDGMVYYKLGQAYDMVGNPDEAVRNYELAETYFTDEDWQSSAREGIKRCKRLPALGRLPSNLLEIWKDVLDPRNIPDRSRPMMARAAVEKTVTALIQELGLPQSGNELRFKLQNIKRHVPDEVFEAMNTAKGHGDDAAHGADVSRDQAEICLIASRVIIRFLIERRG